MAPYAPSSKSLVPNFAAVTEVDNYGELARLPVGVAHRPKPKRLSAVGFCERPTWLGCWAVMPILSLPADREFLLRDGCRTSRTLGTLSFYENFTLP